MGRPNPPVVRNALVDGVEEFCSASSRPEPASRIAASTMTCDPSASAFDAVTAWPCSIWIAPPGKPRRPADEISRDEIFMQRYLGLYDYRVIRCRAPTFPDLRTFAIDLGRYVIGLHPIQTTANARYRKTLDRNDIPHARHCRTPTDEKRRNAPRNWPMISASTVR